MRYKAFISYRHLEPDKTVAKRLQRLLENIKQPKGVSNWRIFRDESELPTSSNLSDDIDAALRESEYLIVICSRALGESRWCLQEIETFKRLHEGSTEKIFTILVDGTPNESFPRELCFSAKKREIDGREIIENVEVEPLAANVVAKTDAERIKLLNTEYLRIAAPMMGVTYDQLYDRKKRAKVKKTMTIAGSVAGVVTVASIAFGVYSSAVSRQISEQNTRIMAQNSQINEQNEKINEQLESIKLETTNSYNIQAKNYSEDNKKRDAIETVLKAYEINDNHEALTYESDIILADSIGAYNKSSIIPVRRLEHEESGSEMWLLMEGKRVLTTDKGGHAYLWDTETGERIWKSEDGVTAGDIIINTPRKLRSRGTVEGGTVNYLTCDGEFTLTLGNRTDTDNDIVESPDFFYYYDSDEKVAKRVDVKNGECTGHEVEADSTFIATTNGFSSITYKGSEKRLVIYDYSTGNTKSILMEDDLVEGTYSLAGVIDDKVFFKNSEGDLLYCTIEGDSLSQCEYLVRPGRKVFKYTLYDFGDYILVEDHEGELLGIDYSNLRLIDKKTMTVLWTDRVSVMGTMICDAGILMENDLNAKESITDSDVVFYVYANKIRFYNASTGEVIKDRLYDNGIVDFLYQKDGAFFITKTDGKTEAVTYKGILNSIGGLLIQKDMPEMVKHGYDKGIDAVCEGYNFVDIYKTVNNEDCQTNMLLENDDQNQDRIEDTFLTDDGKCMIVQTKKCIYKINLQTGDRTVIDEIEDTIETGDGVNLRWENVEYNSVFLQGDRLWVAKSSPDYTNLDWKAVKVFDVQTGSMLGEVKDFPSVLPLNADFAIRKYDDYPKNGFRFYNESMDETVSVVEDNIDAWNLFASDDGDEILYFTTTLNEDYSINYSLHVYSRSKDKDECLATELDYGSGNIAVSFRRDGEKIGYTNEKNPQGFYLIDVENENHRFVEMPGKSIERVYLADEKIYVFGALYDTYIYDYDGNLIGNTNLDKYTDGTFYSKYEIAEKGENTLMLRADLLHSVFTVSEGRGEIFLIDMNSDTVKQRIPCNMYDPVQNRVYGVNSKEIFSFDVISGSKLYNKAKKLIR